MHCGNRCWTRPTPAPAEGLTLDQGLFVGRSGHWPPLVATTAIVSSAVAEIVGVLRGFFQHRPNAAIDPLRSVAHTPQSRHSTLQRQSIQLAMCRPPPSGERGCRSWWCSCPSAPASPAPCGCLCPIAADASRRDGARCARRRAWQSLCLRQPSRRDAGAVLLTRGGGEPSARLACRLSWFVYACVFAQSIDQEPHLQATSLSKSCPERRTRASLFCRICVIH